MSYIAFLLKVSLCTEANDLKMWTNPTVWAQVLCNPSVKILFFCGHNILFIVHSCIMFCNCGERATEVYFTRKGRNVTGNNFMPLPYNKTFV